MDTLSHALWGSGLFGYRGHFWLALFFGAFPDLFSFGIFMLMQLANGQFTPGAPPLSIIPDWLFTSYDTTHSLVIAGGAIAIVAALNRNLAFAMLGWPFHILLDAPFHSAAYFPTRVFYPLSDFYIDGIPWNRPWIWYPNLAGVLLLLTWRLWVRRNNRNARS
jgi:hypothetical protein